MCDANCTPSFYVVLFVSEGFRPLHDHISLRLFVSCSALPPKQVLHLYYNPDWFLALPLYLIFFIIIPKQSQNNRSSFRTKAPSLCDVSLLYFKFLHWRRNCFVFFFPQSSALCFSDSGPYLLSDYIISCTGLAPVTSLCHSRHLTKTAVSVGSGSVPK